MIYFSLISLLSLVFMSWVGFYYLTKPIQLLVNIAKKYQGDESKVFKRRKYFSNCEYVSQTFYALVEKLEKQTSSFFEECNEKELILESLAEGVIAIDAQGKVRYANVMSCKMFEIPKRHLIGKNFWELRSETSLPLIERCKKLLQFCQECNSILTDSVSFGIKRKIYLDLIAAPKTGNLGAIIILQDKSSNYKVLEIGKDFVSNASHELRTPITIIKGFAETLQELPELSSEMLVDITEKIVRNCQRMDNLVRNLLILADIENLPKNRFKKGNLLSLIENCRHSLFSFYPEADIEIEKNQDEIELAADFDLLELALMNLFGNAAKYSASNPEIKIKITARKEEVQILIGDNGIGIPTADLEHIFERFYTVNKARSRRLGGAGLGLSIVKTIIEKHEGSIAVESILGKGTSFTIILPVFQVS